MENKIKTATIILTASILVLVMAKPQIPDTWHLDWRRNAPTPTAVSPTDPAPVFGPPAPPREYLQIYRYLDKHNSPYAEYTSTFWNSANTAGIAPSFLVAVGIFESGWYRTCPSWNCFGITSGTGYARYGSAEEGIAAAARLLGGSYYAGKTIDQIARIYCPPNAENWAANVRYFQQELEAI